MIAATAVLALAPPVASQEFGVGAKVWLTILAVIVLACLIGWLRRLMS